MSSINIPVLIIGAGPAGTSASIFLTKDKISHIILEKESFPRDKICGDACSGKTSEVIRKANPEWLQEITNSKKQFLPCDGIKFVAPNGKSLHVPFRLTASEHNEVIGFTSPRLTFDHFLFEKASDSAYATIYQNVKNLKIERCSNGQIRATATHNRQKIEIITSLIIAADGDKSIVGKTFAHNQENKKSDCVGVRAYYKNVKELDSNNFIELHFMKGFLPAYFWIFPLPDGKANVGAGMLSRYVRKHKINLRERMLDTIREHPVLSRRFVNAELDGKISGWGLPMASVSRKISGDNYILTGDAAGLVDPFSGEGIGNAMYSGMLAAWASREALSQDNFSDQFLEQQYDDAVYRYFGDEFKISATMQKLCNYPSLFNLVVNKSQKSKALRETISGMFSDLQVRDQLRKPSFYLKVMMNR